MPEGKVLVTGGAGYIGSHTVVALVEAGYEPVIVDSLVNSSELVVPELEQITGKKISFHQIDCLDKEAMAMVFEKEKTISSVIHFAAFKAVGESVEQPLVYYKNNVGSLIVLLEVLAQYQVAELVFSSSCTVYGVPNLLPVTEATPFQEAASPYGNTKQIGEEILSDVAKSRSGFKCISLRYFNPVGAHTSARIGELPKGVPNNLVPFITQTAAGIRQRLTVFGNDYDTPDGTCIRDFIHVMDLAEAHVAALKALNNSKAGLYDVYNIGTGNGNSVQELIDTFEKVTGNKLNYTFGPRRPGDVPKIFANVEKANKELNWKATKTLEESMATAWKWQLSLEENAN